MVSDISKKPSNLLAQFHSMQLFPFLLSHYVHLPSICLKGSKCGYKCSVAFPCKDKNLYINNSVFI